MEIVLRKRLSFFSEDRSLVPHQIHVFGKLKTMLRHRCCQVSIMSGWEVYGTECESHNIALNCDGRSRLIHERRDFMVIVITRCQCGRSEAQREKAQQEMQHSSSKK